MSSSTHSFFRGSSQDNISTAFQKENTQNKMYSNEEKESRRELPFCMGEIDFLTTGKKQGKVP